ncbi:hypothetical protein Q3G72_012470 [Acer saccharum]|nr:hypothetical protein Q3G72_012470 [Acer saccharum]
MNEQFETKQGMMPWYSIHHPLMVNPAVISYFKEHCHFKRNPILVVLDIQGKVVNSNALHMMWIWESLAFPFTSAREEDLWSKEVWRLELLTGSIDPAIPVWEDERKFVCLYGGEDMEWIRKFTSKAQKVADEIGLPLEMLYVGKSNSKETVRRNMATIAVERLSHTLQDIPLIWFFWVRLESMWHSKMKHNHCMNDETDPILQEIMTILSFDGSNHCWAGIYRGSEMAKAKAKGETILNSFIYFPSWKKNANDISFIPALNQHLRKDHSPHHCNHLVLQDITCTFPERVVCSECNSQMKQSLLAGIYRGSEMAKAKGETILNSFIYFPSWKKNANDISFIPALNQHLRKDHSPHHCNHLVLQDITCTFPERVVCSECNSQMKQSLLAGIYRGSEMAKAKGETILNSFIYFPSWKKNANDISFIPALNQHLRKDHSPHHCNHLVLQDITCTFPERVVCSECNSQMENFIIYRCSN